MRKAAISWILAVSFSVAVAADGFAQDRRIPETREQMQLSFAPLVKKAAPAVVNIYTRKTVRVRRGPTLFDDPFFKRFFGDSFKFGPEGESRREQNSLGSGVIVDPKGAIVTNRHVIEGADEITVVLADRREFPASIVGADERTDLAILKIDAKGESLRALEFKDSDEVEVGDLVLAIGNPFGVGQTVTSGIVSAVARTRVGISDLGSFIQTDAAINPGNSGGALISMDGRLVGVNTAIFSRSGGSHGIGFAIPSNLVRAVLAGFLQGEGKLVRPWLGAWGTAVGSDVAKALGLDRPVGVVVETVYPGGPAAQAGLVPGDVVLAVNGREVDDSRGLNYRIATLPVGQRATLKVWRKKRTVEIAVALRPPPETPPRDVTQLGGNQPLAGAVVANLSPALAEELGMDRVRPGVVVLEVPRGSIAGRFGLRPGDVVLEVNGSKIATVASLAKALDGGGARWAIAIERGGRVLSMVIDR